jgi:hypothetical protein
MLEPYAASGAVAVPGGTSARNEPSRWNQGVVAFVPPRESFVVGRIRKREDGLRTPRALNRTLAKHNPEGAFGSPFEIVGEKLFTKGEKIATLNRWRQSLLKELDAGSEGMRTHGISAERARLLEQVEAARNQLS